MISISCQGNSIPIVWECLDKRGGNSNTDERIALIERVLKIIPVTKIDNLLADREFIGHDWFEWLRQKKILCRLRIKGDVVVEHDNRKTTAGKLCRSVKLNQAVTWHTRKKVAGVPLYIVAHRTLKGLLIVVATEKPDGMIEDYCKRWDIETLFGCLKGRGFDMESTHMMEHDRMDKLMGLLAIVFAWCLLVGHWHYGKANQLPLNKHNRPAKSLFRLGLDMLGRVLKNKCIKNDQLSLQGAKCFVPYIAPGVSSIWVKQQLSWYIASLRWGW